MKRQRVAALIHGGDGFELSALGLHDFQRGGGLGLSLGRFRAWARRGGCARLLVAELEKVLENIAAVCNRARLDSFKIARQCYVLFPCEYLNETVFSEVNSALPHVLFPVDVYHVRAVNLGYLIHMIEHMKALFAIATLSVARRVFAQYLTVKERLHSRVDVSKIIYEVVEVEPD